MNSVSKPALRAISGRTGRALAILVATTVVATGGGVVLSATPAFAAAGCEVVYSTTEWDGGFNVNLEITNLGDDLNEWTFAFDFDGDQEVTQGWNGQISQDDEHVEILNESYNGLLETGATVNPGFSGSFDEDNSEPISFYLNGVECTGDIEYDEEYEFGTDFDDSDEDESDDEWDGYLPRRPWSMS